jgi:WS/DGAT/MGAT family acyltransferase
MAKTQALGPGDSFFLVTESDNTPNQVGVLVRLKLPKGAPKSYVADMVKHFKQFPVKESPFNKKLAPNTLKDPMPSWEIEKDVDLDYHLRHSALPYPGGERELAQLISRLHSIPLDHARPMWEIHAIEGLEDDCFAIYSKMHHALVDGVAGSKMVARWTSVSSEVDDNFMPLWSQPKPKRSKKAKTEAATQTSSLMDQVTDPLKSIAGVASATWDTLLGGRGKGTPGLIAPYSAPETILNVPVGPARRVSIVEFKTERLKDVATALGGTLNDVVMAMCGGALRGYLQEQNALPKKRLVGQVPVSIRPKDGPEEGNAIGMLLANLGTDIADPIERFKAVNQSMTAGKTMLRSMNKEQITAYAALLTLPFTIGQITGIGNRRRKPMSNVVVSNVPGPQEKRYLNGAEVLNISPISFIMQGQALNITQFSYDDRISFVYIACRKSLPSVQKLVPHTEQALKDLEDAVKKMKKRKTTTKRAATKK